MLLKRCSITFGFVLVLAMHSSGAILEFIRGDVDGDGIVNVTDMVQLTSYFYTSGPGPVDCSGAPCLDAGDINDNEWITYADILYLNESLFAGAPAVPPPAVCGCDLSNGDGGFGQVNAAYVVNGNINITASTAAVVLNATIPAGSRIKAATVVLAFDPVLVLQPAATQFTPATGTTLVNLFSVGGNRLVITVGCAPGGTMPVTPAGNVKLGIVNFNHAGWAGCTPPPVSLQPDAMTAAGLVYRATLIDNRYIDHHPQLSPITCTRATGNFIRGDVDGDGFINATDMVRLANYFYSGGPGPIDCSGLALLDPGDANDNEWITHADILYISEFLFVGTAPIPAPATCGADPNNLQKGFQAINTSYSLLSSVNLTTTTADVSLQATIPAGGAIKAATAVVEFGPGLTPASPALFTPSTGVAFMNGTVIGNRIVVTAGRTGGGTLPMTGVNVPLGTVHFTHNGWTSCVTHGVSLKPDAMSAGGIHYRATVIDNAFADHHPQLPATTCTPVVSRFIRGDVDGDTVINVTDVNRLTQYLFAAGPGPLDCTFNPQVDSGDVNDNEWITIADILYLADSLFVGGTPPIPAPAPPTCGVDPNNNQRGFNRTNAAYDAYATTNIKPGSAEVLLEVGVPPAAGGVTAKATTLIVQFDPGLRPKRTPFVPASGVDLHHAAVMGNCVVVTVGNKTTGRLPGHYGCQTRRIYLGYLDFTHNGWAGCTPMPVRFLPDLAAASGVVYRATIVDRNYNDHHPQLHPAACLRFLRGDANGDLIIDLADPISVLSCLFRNGRTPCWAAYDANGSGAVDLSDAIFLLGFLFTPGAPIPPQPYPCCGPDLSPSPLPCANSPCP